MTDSISNTLFSQVAFVWLSVLSEPNSISLSVYSLSNIISREGSADSYSFVLSTCPNNLLVFTYNVIETILFCFRFRRWRYLQICFNFVKLLIRYDVALPASAVKLCVKFLNHDALAIRKVSATFNSHNLREMLACGIRNPANIFLLWNLESWALESGKQLKNSGFPLTIGIRNPESTVWKPESKTVLDCLEFPYMIRLQNLL